MKRFFLLFAISLFTVANCFAQKPKDAPIKPIDWYADVNLSALWKLSNNDNNGLAWQHSLDFTWYWRVNDSFNLGAGLSFSTMKCISSLQAYSHPIYGYESGVHWEPFLSPHISIKGCMPVNRVLSLFASADLGAYVYFSNKTRVEKSAHNYFGQCHFYILPKAGAKFKMSDKGTSMYIAATYELIPYFFSRSEDRNRDFIGLCIGVEL